MTDPRPSFLRVWLGLLLLLAITAFPTVLAAWLLSLMPMPWWLGSIVMMIFALSCAAWMMTSPWLVKQLTTLSRWSGMLP